MACVGGRGQRKGWVGENNCIGILIFAVGRITSSGQGREVTDQLFKSYTLK